jgi:ATP synthase F0 subunit b
MIFAIIDINGGGIVSLETIAKLINLVVFVGLAIYFLRRPLSEKLDERREGVRRDLMRAREERDAALAKLAEVEARLGNLNAEVESVREQARREAAEERERIRRQTEEDALKIRGQAQREIESISKAARADLRTYAAEQSIRLAEEMIRREMKPEDDARLINEYVEDLGGIRR